MRARHVWLAISLLLVPLAGAFSFTDTPGTQCDNIDIEWSGGVPPFQLLLIPVFGTQRNVSIPAAAFSNGRGRFSTQLTFRQDAQYLLSMSDATGLGTGGYTPVRTVGPSQGGSCDTTMPSVAFNFELNSALQQCRPFTFSGYPNAIQPVTAMAIVPGGNAVILSSQSGPSFNWVASAASGTSMIFLMFDAAGRPGGSSDVRTVGLTDDATCLNANSPSSTTSSASPTSSSTNSQTPRPTSSASQTSSAASATSTSTEGGFSTAAIAGTIAGALVFLAVAITLGLFCLKRSRFNQSKPQQMPSQIDLMDSNPNYHPYRDNYTPGSSPFLPAGGQYEPTPYMLSQSNLPHSQHPSQYGQDPTGPVGHPQYQNVQPYADYTHGPPPPQSYGHVPPPVGAIPLGHRPGAPSVSNTEATSSAEQSNRQSMASTTLTAAQRKAAMAGESAYKPPSRFILHTDADDELPLPNEDGIVELPPQYTERRAPSTPLQTQPPVNAPYPPPADAYQPQS